MNLNVSILYYLTFYLNLDGQEIAHAIVMNHQASPIVYKDDYNKNVLGQGPANPAIAFPENDRLKKIHDQTTKVQLFSKIYNFKVKTNH